MRKIQVEFGQSIWDLGLQEYGHVDGAFVLVEDNPQYAITDVPVPGAMVLVQDEVPRLSDTNQAIAAEIKRLGLKMACGMPTNIIPQSPNYIAPGYWQNGYSIQKLTA